MHRGIEIGVSAAALTAAVAIPVSQFAAGNWGIGPRPELLPEGVLPPTDPFAPYQSYYFQEETIHALEAAPVNPSTKEFSDYLTNLGIIIDGEINCAPPSAVETNIYPEPELFERDDRYIDITPDEAFEKGWIPIAHFIISSTEVSQSDGTYNTEFNVEEWFNTYTEAAKIIDKKSCDLSINPAYSPTEDSFVRVNGVFPNFSSTWYVRQQ